MIYRSYGNTGERVSALGFGCMRLPEVERDGVFSVDQDKTDEMLRRAVELGVNYFDTAYYYCHENSEIAVGKALAPVRDRVLISTKCPVDEVKKPGDYRAFCEKSLQKLGTDHIDFYHFWAINKVEFDHMCELRLLEEAEKLKAEGLIRHISFSFHDHPKYIQYILERAPQMESMLVQYNLLDRRNAKMIDYAASRGLGVAAMGPVAGGRLAAPATLRQSVTGQEATAAYELALRYVLANPGISIALSGMETLEMVERNAAVAAQARKLTTAEQKEVVRTRVMCKKFSELYCTGCKYCQPCPRGIEIPRLFQAYTYQNVYGAGELARAEWEGYAAGHRFAECADCGLCEEKCPHKLKIRELLPKAEALFAQA